MRFDFGSRLASPVRSRPTVRPLPLRGCTMPRKHPRCLGSLRPKRPCALSRNGFGEPMHVRKECPRCGEQRCRTHCKCGRTGEAHGRSAGRTGAPAGEAGPAKMRAVAPVLPLAQQHPVTAPPAKVDIYDEATWLPQAAKEVAGATSVLLSTTMYDARALHSALVQRLKRAPECEVHVIVDRGEHEAETCKAQKAMLSSLAAGGAKIWLGTGHSGRHRYGPKGRAGYMHRKALVLHSRIAFVGGSNATESSHKNAELVCRIEGPSVQGDMGKVLAIRARAVEWG